MYIVKHKPTGKYIRKCANPNYYLRNYPDRILTDNIKKARIYTTIGHAKLSLGDLVVVGTKEESRYNIRTGEKYTEIRNEYGYKINEELFEIIEVSMEIKE